MTFYKQSCSTHSWILIAYLLLSMLKDANLFGDETALISYTES